jgi:hypothetical protein
VNPARARAYRRGPGADPTAGAPGGDPGLAWFEAADALLLASWCANATEVAAEAEPELPGGEPPAPEPADPPLPTAEPLPPPVPLPEMAASAALPLPLPGSGSLPLSVTKLAVPALAGARQLIRRLRLLKRTIESHRDAELDEEATAEHAAEDGLWLPYTQPASERWLDLVLVVDDTPSMRLWQPLIADFVRLLQQLAAFRNVMVRFLGQQADSRHPSGVRAVVRGEAADSPAGDPAELVDPSGRRAILAVTDGLGAPWRTGAGDRALGTWGRHGPVAVVHLLPSQSWPSTAVAPRRARLRAPERAAANKRLSVHVPDDWRNPFEPLPENWSLPVPVLELDADWLGWWARLIAGRQQDWMDAAVLLVGASGGRQEPAGDRAEPSGAAEDAADEQDDQQDDADLTAHERVMRFRVQASRTAYRLATCLAAAPLEMRFIRMIQRALLPESSQRHLAEVMSSGLIEPLDPPPTGTSPHPSFDFIEGAREALLAGATRSETAQVFCATSEFYGDHAEVTRGLQEVLLAPDTVADSPVNRESLPFVRVELAVLKALSGPYLNRARRLDDAIAQLQDDHRHEIAPSSQNSPPPPHPDDPDTVGTTMTETAGSLRSAPDQTRRDPDAESVAPATIAAELAPTGGDPTTGAAFVPPLTPDRADQRYSPRLPPVWGRIPAANPNFTGREEQLAKLHEQLRTSSAAAVLPHTLYGMGGVGKSQIAIEYVYRHADEYDVVWWIPAEQPGQILTALVELAQRLGLEVGTDATTAVPAVLEALRTGRPYSKWLLVFDNAEDVDAVQRQLPGSGTGKILVTSRNPEWDQWARTLSVDVFTRDESKQLLRRRTRDLSDSDADRLAEALGDLPLAIEQAAAWHAATGMAVDEYLGLIEDKRAELLGLEKSTDYPKSVAAAWTLSLDRLAGHDPAALQLLQVCAFFAPDSISRNLFSGARNAEVARELDEARRDPIKLARAIRDLNRYALVRIQHRDNTLQLHRMVQAVLIARMSAQQQADMRHAAHRLLADADPGNPNEATQWPRYQALLPHVTASRVIDNDDPWVRQLLIGMVQFLYYWGDHVGGRDLAGTIFLTWRDRFGEDDPQTVELTWWYAYLLRVLGEFAEAAALNAENVEICRRTAGEDHEATLAGIGQMAADLRVKGEFARAQALDEDVLARCKRLFGEDDPTTLNAAHNLAVSLRLAGDFRSALELDQDTWERRATVFGVDSDATLNTLNGLGIDERECGDYLGSRARQEETYRRYVRVMGITNPATVRAARVLSVCRRRAGDLEGARRLSEDTLERFQRRYGDTYPDTLATATNLAVDLRQTGDLAAARDLGQRTYEQYRDTLGERHPYTLSARTNLAITLRLLGELDEAYEHAAVALAAFRETLGDDHVLSLLCELTHASNLFVRGAIGEAAAVDGALLTRLRRVLGDRHPAALACALNLALDLRGLGRTTEAETLHGQTISHFRAVLGDGHPATLAATKSERADCDIAPMPL